MKVGYLIIVFCFVLLSCEDDAEQEPFIKTGTYSGEYWPTQSWSYCEPSEVGLDNSLLEDMDSYVETKIQDGYDMHSILIVKDGYIVAEKNYNRYFDEDIEHNVYSCTKSVTSALIGIAIDQGYIDSVGQKILPLFDSYDLENYSTLKEEISIKHLLTMSAGLEWHELDFAYGDSRNTFRSFSSSEDKVKFVLDQPMETNPGTLQNYNTGLSHVLSAIIQKTTHTRLDSFAITNLFSRIGIDSFSWPTDGNGIIQGGSELRLTPRNMARFGYLLLKNGEWDGDKILSSEWVNDTQQWHLDFQHKPGFGYGYQYWISSFGAYCAVGYKGQWIMIFPEHEMVVVFTNDFDPSSQEEWDFPEYLIRNYVLHSIID